MAVWMVQVVNPTFVFGVGVKVSTLVINVAQPSQLLAVNVKMYVGHFVAVYLQEMSKCMLVIL
jgi:hypothetical protein